MPEQSESHANDSHWEEISKNREEILNVRAEVARRRSTLSALIEHVGSSLANPRFSPASWLPISHGSC